jgi:hypothetical protein
MIMRIGLVRRSMMLLGKGEFYIYPLRAKNGPVLIRPSYRKSRTRDMGGQATTHEFTAAVLDKMEKAL